MKRRGGEQAFFHQTFQTDEQRITGECREALIRRVAVTCGAERQNLPQSLSGVLQKIDEAAGFEAEIPDPETTGQRGRVQQNAAGPGESGAGCH
jgi:hypothetical protein